MFFIARTPSWPQPFSLTVDIEWLIASPYGGWFPRFAFIYYYWFDFWIVIIIIEYNTAFNTKFVAILCPLFKAAQCRRHHNTEEPLAAGRLRLKGHRPRALRCEGEGRGCLANGTLGKTEHTRQGLCVYGRCWRLWCVCRVWGKEEEEETFRWHENLTSS